MILRSILTMSDCPRVLFRLCPFLKKVHLCTLGLYLFWDWVKNVVAMNLSCQMIRHVAKKPSSLTYLEEKTKANLLKLLHSLCMGILQSDFLLQLLCNFMLCYDWLAL